MKNATVLALTVALGTMSCTYKGGYTVQSPYGPVTIEFEDPKKAYEELERALAKCLALQTDAAISGDFELSECVAELIERISEAKEELSDNQPTSQTAAASQ